MRSEAQVRKRQAGCHEIAETLPPIRDLFALQRGSQSHRGCARNMNEIMRSRVYQNVDLECVNQNEYPITPIHALILPGQSCRVHPNRRKLERVIVARADDSNIREIPEYSLG